MTSGPRKRALLLSGFRDERETHVPGPGSQEGGAPPYAPEEQPSGLCGSSPAWARPTTWGGQSAHSVPTLVSSRNTPTDTQNAAPSGGCIKCTVTASYGARPRGAGGHGKTSHSPGSGQGLHAAAWPLTRLLLPGGSLQSGGHPAVPHAPYAASYAQPPALMCLLLTGRRGAESAAAPSPGRVVPAPRDISQTLRLRGPPSATTRPGAPHQVPSLQGIWVVAVPSPPPSHPRVQDAQRLSPAYQESTAKQTRGK